MIATSLARLVPAAMLAACLLSAPALAQQPSAASVNAARELVELKGGATMFDPVIVSVIEQTKAALLQTNPQLAKDLNDVATQLRAEFTPRRNELMNEAAKLYAAALHRAGNQGHDDVLQVAARQEDDRDRSRRYSTQTFNYVEQWGPRVAEEAMNRFRAEMKKKGHNL